MTPAERRAPRAPAHLSDPAKALWRAVTAEYVLQPHHEAIFQAALEARDRMTEAQALVAAEGMTVEGRFGPKLHPALAIERDGRLAFARLVRELGLDLSDPPVSRPPTRWR